MKKVVLFIMNFFATCNGEDADCFIIPDYERSGDDYANARTLRNILDQVLLNQNLRTEHSVGENSVLRTDVEEYIQDEQIDLTHSSKQLGKIGFSL